MHIDSMHRTTKHAQQQPSSLHSLFATIAQKIERLLEVLGEYYSTADAPIERIPAIVPIAIVATSITIIFAPSRRCSPHLDALLRAHRLHRSAGLGHILPGLGRILHGLGCTLHGLGHILHSRCHS